LAVVFAYRFGLSKRQEQPSQDADSLSGVERGVVAAPDKDTGGRGTVITPENVQDFLAEKDKPIEDASYTCSMSTEWTFDKWDKPSPNAYIENYPDNTRTVYCDVYLDDENGDAIMEELVYSSPYIEVGAEVKNFALQKEVPAGDYSATIIYYLVDDNHEVITDVSVGIRLIIKG